MSKRTTKHRRAARARAMIYRHGSYLHIDRSPGHILALWGTMDLEQAIKIACKSVYVPIIISGLEEP